MTIVDRIGKIMFTTTITIMIATIFQ